MLAVEKKALKTAELIKFFKTKSFSPQEVNPILKKNNSSAVKQSDKLSKILSRPRLSRIDLENLSSVKAFIKDNKVSDEVFEQAEIQIKYSGYIEKEMANAEKLSRLDHIKIPDDFDYDTLASLSQEAKEKLNYIKPTNLSQASRISGINPSDISVLLVKLGR